MTRQECCNYVRSLAKLHSGYPSVLANELGRLLDESHSTTESSVYRFAQRRAEKTADKVDALESQSAQYRAKAALVRFPDEARYLESMALANDQRVERLKSSLAANLFDGRRR